MITESFGAPVQRGLPVILFTGERQILAPAGNLC